VQADQRPGASGNEILVLDVLSFFLGPLLGPSAQIARRPALRALLWLLSLWACCNIRRGFPFIIETNPGSPVLIADP